MRIDHQAYQRATRVAGFGFIVQLAIGLTMLILSLVGGEAGVQDTPFLFASIFILIGLLAWLGLIILFNQHKLERLEALEQDELASTRAGGADKSVFSDADDEIRVAARRLRLMHKWFMPILSLAIAAALAGCATLMWRQMSLVKAEEAEFHLTDHIGWAVAIALAFSALSFIVSRFVAGMAKLPAWQNLRGGAAYMVGNAIVTLAVAIGIGFRFFDNDDVIRWITNGLFAFMYVVAGEIVLNFVLNLYRPRIAGETPRPAFDSKLLSLFSAPDNIVRTINDAVNYQFGFDITGSWGYQLLIRSFAWLIALGALVLLSLNMLVIVEPHEQAVKLARGAIVGDEVHDSGVMIKWPWPIETAEKHDVSRVRTLHLTGKQVVPAEIQLWTDDLGKKFDRPLEPFLVGRSRLERVESRGTTRDRAADLPGEVGEGISQRMSLLDAEIAVQYRIERDGGLLDYLAFSSDRLLRRQDVTAREQALRAIALRPVSQTLSTFSIDDVLAGRRGELATRLRDDVQAAFDAAATGIEVVSVDLLMIRPAGEVAGTFQDLSMSREARAQLIAQVEQIVQRGYAQIVGSPDRVDAILAAHDAWEDAKAEHGDDAPETLAAQVELEQLIRRAGGLAAQEIASAERDRLVEWVEAGTQASRVRGQLGSYRAAPRLYKQRETMLVYQETLGDLYKYIIGIDPARVKFDMDLTELNTVLNLGDVLSDEQETGP